MVFVVVTIIQRDTTISLPPYLHATIILDSVCSLLLLLSSSESARALHQRNHVSGVSGVSPCSFNTYSHPFQTFHSLHQSLTANYTNAQRHSKALC